MANFARIENGLVREVIVIDDADCGGDYPQSDVNGQAFIASLGIKGEWRQTCYDGSFRGTYAGIGFTYDEVNDVFIPQGYTYDAVNDVFVASTIEEEPA